MAEPQAQAASHSLEQLPVEILQDIFCYFDITDIVCIRRISRYFNEVTRSREVWSDAYRRAGFIRPPGPFPTQTSNELERALVTSFKVDRNLRCGNARRGTPVVTSQEIRYTGVDLHVCLLFGKYLVIAFSDEVRCYNVDASDSESGPYIVFKPSGILKSFQCFSSTDGEGRPLACAIIHEIIRTPSERARQATVYTIEKDDSEKITFSPVYHLEHGDFSIEQAALGPRVLAIQGSVDYADNDRNMVVVDMRTHTRLALPPVTRTLMEVQESMNADEMTPLSCLSTSTHLISSISILNDDTGWHTLLEAFAIPPPNQSQQPSSLRVSHRGIISGVTLSQCVLLQDSVVEPVTGDVLIKIRAHDYEPHRPRNPISAYGHLRLLTPQSTDSVGTIEYDSLGRLGERPNALFLHPSVNGTGRVFYAPVPGFYDKIAVLQYDVSGDGEAKAVEYPAVLKFPLSSGRYLGDYDQYRGRLCCRCVMSKYRSIEILDFA